MPVLPPMGCNELAELELESVALAASAASTAAATVAAAQHQHQHHHGLPAAAAIKQPKQKGGRRQPKIETLDLSSPPPPAPAAAPLDTNKLGVRNNAKFKKPIVSTGNASGWLAMMDNDAAAFFLGQQQHQQQQQQHHHPHQQQQCEPLQILAPNTTTAITTTITAPAAAKSEKSGKSNSSNNGNSNNDGAAKAESSGTRKYYPAPFCSCTGTNQQCYRWGNGGWQSACCTTKISMYPLPMNPKKKGSRVAGRKMSAGAFMKLVDRLTAEGVDVNSSVDLRPHWAKHGTNRYVTIK